MESIAFMADIEAMFHQVRVPKIDQNALRFLWWKNGDLMTEPRPYKMTVHLFGGTWSPSCCTYAVHKTIEDHKVLFSTAAQYTARHNLYVDELLKSVPTADEAIQLSKELKELMEKGGFNLTKWISNSRQVMEAIPEADRAKKVKTLTSDALPVERALGLHWDV